MTSSNEEWLRRVADERGETLRVLDSWAASESMDTADLTVRALLHRVRQIIATGHRPDGGRASDKSVVFRSYKITRENAGPGVATASVQGVTRVEFTAGHVVFRGADGQIIVAESNARVASLRDVTTDAGR